MPPRSICLLRLSAIGDVCNAVAVAQAIRRQYPQATLTWVIGKVEAELLRGLPGIEFVVFDKRAGLTGLRELRRALRGRRFDVLLLMQLALRAGVASLMVPARRRIGYDRARSKELHGLFINERIGARRGDHVLDSFRQFAEAIGVTDTTPHWDIPVAEADDAWAAAALEPNRARHFVIAPAASAAERNWLPERYAALADHAAARGFAVYLCGGPGAADRKLAAEITRHAQATVHDLVGQTSLKQLFALLRRASLALMPDTGPAHMAAAAGTPVIGLYAHSNPARTGPWRWRQYVVEVWHDRLAAEHGKAGGQARWGQRLKGQDLMAAIAVGPVTAMFDRVVSEQRL